MLTSLFQFISQSLSTTVVAFISRLKSLPTEPILPSVQVVSQISTPPASCELPSLYPAAAASECTLCADGQQLAVARSSSSDLLYFRVIFYGRSCGPWQLVSPPAAPVLSDNHSHRDKSENVLRIASAEYSALMLLPVPGPVSSSLIADRRSFQSTRALRLQSLSAAAAALVDYPSASSFLVSHKPLFYEDGKPISSQALRSHIVVETSRPQLSPGRLSWRVSNDVAVVPDSKPLWFQLLVCFTRFAGDNRLVQVLLFTDNVISSSLSLSLILPAPPICDVLPSVISVQAGLRLEQNIMFRNCRMRGNATLVFQCGGCGAEDLRVVVLCP